MPKRPDRDCLLALVRHLRESSSSPAGISPAERELLAAWLESQVPAGAAPPAGRGPTGRVRLHSDGASRGNPGPAAAGFVLYDADGQEIYSEGVALGTLTNNQAEYRALLLGLAAAARLSVQDLEIALDSELIVRQLEGRYKVKNAGLKPLYEEARLALHGFRSWRVHHVPRAENHVADALANEALDSL